MSAASTSPGARQVNYSGSAIGIVREDATHFALRVEFHPFRREQAVDAPAL